MLRQKPSDFKKLTFEDELTMRKQLCNYFVDARWFGMVNTSYSSYNTLGKIEGAFQLSFPMSYDPIRIASISNTRCCVSSDEERKGNEKVPKTKTVRWAVSALLSMVCITCTFRPVPKQFCETV